MTTDSRRFRDAAVRPTGDFVVLADYLYQGETLISSNSFLKFSREGALEWEKGFPRPDLDLHFISLSPYDGRSAAWGSGASGTPMLTLLSGDGSTQLPGDSNHQHFSFEGGGFGPGGQFVFQEQGLGFYHLKLAPDGGSVPLDDSFRVHDAVFAPDGDLIVVGMSRIPVAAAHASVGQSEEYWVVMKRGLDGTVRWAQNFEGAQLASGEILLSSAGEVYVSGTLSSGELTFPGGTISADTQEGSLHVVVALGAQGERRWGKVLRWTAAEFHTYGEKGFSDFRLAADGSLVAYFGGCEEQLQVIRISEYGQTQGEQLVDVGAETCIEDVEMLPAGVLLVGRFSEGEVSLGGQAFPATSGIEYGGFAAILSPSPKP